MIADQMGLRLPAHSLEAEQSVLGGLLLANTAWDRIADVLTDADFYRNDHRALFAAIRGLIADSKPADLLTVTEALQQSGALERAGGQAYIADLVAACPSAANIRRYAEIVREKAMLRSLGEIGAAIADSAYSPGKALEKVDAAQTAVLGLTEGRATGKAAVSLSDALAQVIIRIDEAHKNGTKVLLGVTTGLTDLDRMLQGYRAPKFYCLAARPAMGKSALALQASIAAALAGVPALYFSAEMDATELAERALSARARVASQSLRTGTMETEEWDRLGSAVGSLHELPLYIDDQASPSIQYVVSRARAMKRSHGIGMVIVDYLQLLTARPAENRTQEIDTISRALKGLAKTLQVPVIGLSQLNRELERRVNKRPVLSDLREGGGIEQDADVVVFIYRDEVYNKDSQDAGTAELIIAKHRGGPTGTVRVTWVPHLTEFRDLDRHWAPRPAQRPKGGLYGDLD